MKLVKAKTAARILVLMLSCGVGMLATPPAQADEGGTSFWLPGQFGSLERGARRYRLVLAADLFPRVNRCWWRR